MVSNLISTSCFSVALICSSEIVQGNFVIINSLSHFHDDSSFLEIERWPQNWFSAGESSFSFGYRKLCRKINPSTGITPEKKATVLAHPQLIPDFIVTCFCICYQNGVRHTLRLPQTDVICHSYHIVMSGMVSDMIIKYQVMWLGSCETSAFKSCHPSLPHKKQSIAY